jgi:O-antigen ligase
MEIRHDATVTTSGNGILMKRLEQVLVVTLSGLGVSLFFSQTGIDIFGITSLFVLVMGSFALRHERRHRFPRYLLAAAAIYLFGQLFGAFESDYQLRAFSDVKKFWNIFLCGLLIAYPFEEKSRRRVMAFFFTGAIAVSIMGIFQHYGIFFEKAGRAHGLTHPIHFAANLAFVCASALILIAMPNNIISRSGKNFLFLATTALISFVGMVMSQTRGVMLAFLGACMIVLLVYNARKGIVFLFSFAVIMALVFAASPALRDRWASTLTSVSTEDESGSTGNRLELWKGSLMIFRKAPVFGTGIGDFQPDIEDLIAAGRLKEMPVRVHAHNIYLQALATQGVVGLCLLIALLASLIAWGSREIRDRGAPGYLLLLFTLLIMLGGLTENNLGVSKVVAAYCFSMGLMGGFGTKNESC